MRKDNEKVSKYEGCQQQVFAQERAVKIIYEKNFTTLKLYHKYNDKVNFL